ncbi:AzlD domain-containing protein [Desulforamulus aeronauticus]|uniref:Branched-chain amino acid transport protein (AzlD) n=1 Tax=Desulforamulus aeronauticus DSM 10349 TaxID=1121421 RepID=A0A1M6UY17_9FIRM|nr:AzlD domain-containing protein [Desulforamulus aeronauticus]SHK74054.1 Branched-chain amino acid transport protein (AzlD) [Desulforamulus aeronauticus DSM 10349]
MSGNIYLYILVMAGVTYLIRLIPLTLLRRDISNVYIKTFLYYVPFVTLAVMIFPAILNATANTWSALGGFVVAVILAYQGSSLFKVSAVACIAVFLIELIIY